MLLCGYYGFGNLGDELIAEALIGLFEKSGVRRDEIALLSAAPQDSLADLGVRSFDRWSFREVLAGLKASDSLLLGGGGLFQDSTSLRSPLYYWGIVRLASLMGSHPWCYGQSVGPLTSSWGRLLARRALALCGPRVLRDEPSMALVESWGLEASRSPDVVLALPSVPLSGPGQALIVNVRPWPGDLPRRTAEEAARLAAKRTCPLIGVALSEEDRRLLERFRDDGICPVEEIRHLRRRDDVQGAFDQAALAVGMRLHFLILALMQGVPAMAVPYDPKVEALARTWSIPLWEGTGHLPAERTQPVDGKWLLAARQTVEADFLSAWRRVEEVLRP
ncbi:MAG: polysaccharide pyruvyl transferase CsaB [Synergistaceae bacterium]|nr:polysaccharide pyruvyl transferase CsaB [Synergistaceae bacterium]